MGYHYSFRLIGHIGPKLEPILEELTSKVAPTGAMIDDNAVHLRFTSPRNNHLMLTINDKGHALIGMLNEGKLITKLVGTNYDINIPEVCRIAIMLKNGVLDDDPSMVKNVFTLDAGSLIN